MGPLNRSPLVIQLSLLSLADNRLVTGALKPLTAGSLPSTSTAPDGSSALIANFPAGTYGLNSANGQGFSFYTEGTHNGVNVEGATEVLFSYSAYFPSGFDFVKGGKMPGLYGGTSLSEAKSCSGGRQIGTSASPLD
jgi:hypothetical protein